MADLRESFTTLENFSTQAGEALHKVLEGDAAASKNASAALVAKDNSGNLTYLTLNASGQLPVTLDSASVCKSGRGTVAGNAAITEVMSITLVNGKTYKDVDWNVSCFRDALFEIVYIQDTGGTPVETIITDVLVGPGAFTHSGELSCQAFTVPAGAEINVLKVRAKNFNATSDFRAALSINEIG